MSAAVRAVLPLLALIAFYALALALVIGTTVGTILLGEHVRLMYGVAAVGSARVRRRTRRRAMDRHCA